MKFEPVCVFFSCKRARRRIELEDQCKVLSDGESQVEFFDYLMTTAAVKFVAYNWTRRSCGKSKITDL